MKTNLSFSSPSEVETDCLVVIALDRGEKDKPNVSLQSDDGNVKSAAADVLANGETTGKIFETTLLHAPAKMKAKRLLIMGGGKEKSFSAYDLRRVAGAAVRTLKSKSIRAIALVVPRVLASEEAVKASVEGAEDRVLHGRRQRRSGQAAASHEPGPGHWRIAKFHSCTGERAE
jgi:leucyl aminopeptidase